MSLSLVGPSGPYSHLKWPLQPASNDPTDASAPSDPLQSLFQAFSGGNSTDPLLSAATSGDGTASSSNTPRFSPDVMKGLLSVQGDQASSNASKLESLFGKFDANGDGQISETEFENAIGPGADKAKVDALFNKLDGNGNGAVTRDELQSAMQKSQGSHHHHHHASSGSSSSQSSDPLQSLLSGVSADGTTSRSSTNADGSSTTTITYADGTKVEMTTPAAANATDTGAASANPGAPNFANLLKQLISLQAQLAAPTTNLSV